MLGHTLLTAADAVLQCTRLQEQQMSTTEVSNHSSSSSSSSDDGPPVEQGQKKTLQQGLLILETDNLRAILRKLPAKDLFGTLPRVCKYLRNVASAVVCESCLHVVLQHNQETAACRARWLQQNGGRLQRLHISGWRWAAQQLQQLLEAMVVAGTAAHTAEQVQPSQLRELTVAPDIWLNVQCASVLADVCVMSPDLQQLQLPTVPAAFVQLRPSLAAVTALSVTECIQPRSTSLPWVAPDPSAVAGLENLRRLQVSFHKP
jgi:hypothetical protein